MKSIFRIGLAIFIICSNKLKSQTDTLSYVTVPDSMPSFVYGPEHYAHFIQINIDYPLEARNKQIEGNVYISFIVDTFGIILNPEVLKDIGGGCGQEAKRVVKLTSGLWIPGIYKGKKSNVKMTMPIKFTCLNCDVPKGEMNAIEIRPNANYYYNQGVAEFNAGRLLTAIFYFTETLKKNSMHLDALYNRGIAKFKNKDIEGACDDWKQGQSFGDNGVSELIKKNCGDKGKIREEICKFPGGDLEMMKYIEKNKKYENKKDKAKGVGIVRIEFSVNKDGSLTDIVVLQSLSEFYDKEAIRLIESMPNWVPGRLNGNPVNIKFTLPIRF